MPPRLILFLVGLPACNPDLEPVVGDRDAPVPVSIRTWSFDVSLEGWDITEREPEEALATATVAWDASDGSPAPGSARLDVPFSDSGQQVSLGLAPVHLDLEGRVLRAMLRLDSGMNVGSETPGGAQLYAFSSELYVWANGPWVMLSTPGEWTQAELVLDAPDSAQEGFDAGDVHEIGVQLSSGATGSHVPAVLHVDAFSIGP